MDPFLGHLKHASVSYCPVLFCQPHLSLLHFTRGLNLCGRHVSFPAPLGCLAPHLPFALAPPVSPQPPLPKYLPHTCGKSSAPTAKVSPTHVREILSPHCQGISHTHVGIMFTPLPPPPRPPPACPTHPPPARTFRNFRSARQSSPNLETKMPPLDRALLSAIEE
jgi:hypothetical protein